MTALPCNLGPPSPCAGRSGRGVPPPTALRPASAAELSQLMVAVAAGEVYAFARLYAGTSRHVHRLALRVLRCPEHAADVTQEVYLQVWQQAGRFDPAGGAVMPWLMTLTHRRAVDRVRRIVAGRRTQEKATGYAGATGDVVVETILARADAEDVRRAVAALSLLQRQALVMVYAEGRTAVQIAAALGAPLGTVKSRIRDGLINLRRAYGVPAVRS